MRIDSKGQKAVPNFPSAAEAAGGTCGKDLEGNEQGRETSVRQRERARAAGLRIRRRRAQGRPDLPEPEKGKFHGILMGLDQQYVVGKLRGSGTWCSLQGDPPQNWCHCSSQGRASLSHNPH